MPRIKVNLGRRSYSVVVERGVIAQLPKLLGPFCKQGQLFVIYDANLYALHGQSIDRSLARMPNKRTVLVVPSGEQSKSRKTLGEIQNYLLSNKVSRSDLIVACGGGAITDLVGYAAASVLRGVNWAAVPTTLMGMVDAAIGGKTAINHPLGKNLIGAFWQPRIVVCDTNLLMTLPKRELVAGLGEVIKYAGLGDQVLLKSVESYLNGQDIYNATGLVRIVARSAACKAAIVARDETDHGVRQHLNLGHTFAHAIENSVGYGRILHGEAVLIGLLAAVNLSCELNGSRTKRLAGFRQIVESSLKLIPRRKIDVEGTLKAMALDKKRIGSNLKFILLDRPGRPIVGGGIAMKLVRKSLTDAVNCYRLLGGSHA